VLEEGGLSEIKRRMDYKQIRNRKRSQRVIKGNKTIQKNHQRLKKGVTPAYIGLWGGVKQDYLCSS